MADQRHLYMIVAGIMLGVILGPAVLGRLAPNAYDKAFVGSGNTTELDAAIHAVDQFENNPETRNATREKIIADHQLIGGPDDSTNIAMEEQLVTLTNKFADTHLTLKSEVTLAQGPVIVRRGMHAVKLAGLATTLLLALGVVFAIESIMGPPTSERNRKIVLAPMLARLVTIRFALMASWLTLMIAQPAPLRRIADHAAFAVILIAVIVVVGFVPLGKRASA